MKRITAIVLVIVAGFCTAGSLQAQSHEVRANIPFDFTVSGKLLPSGSYRFISESSDTILIQNRYQRIGVLSIVLEAGGAPRNDSRLIFHKYGDRYFLSGIHSTATAMNVEIPRSKLEKQVRQQRAWLGPEQILVAMN